MYSRAKSFVYLSIIIKERFGMRYANGTKRFSMERRRTTGPSGRALRNFWKKPDKGAKKCSVMRTERQLK